MSVLSLSNLGCASLSSRRAWIEILLRGGFRLFLPASLSSRRAWIEIKQIGGASKLSESLSSRRAWIEISPDSDEIMDWCVALLAEGVD